MAWQWEQNGRVAELIHEGLDFKNRIKKMVAFEETNDENLNVLMPFSLGT